MDDFNLEQLPRKKKRKSINTSYSFSCTPEIKEGLTHLSRETDLDVNESFRLFSDFLINKAHEDDQSA